MDSYSSSKDSSPTGMSRSTSYKKSNKIRDIVRLQQIIKKWRNLAVSNSPSGAGAATTSPGGGSSSKGIRFLKRTLSNLSEYKEKENAAGVVPKGYLAVTVGAEEKRFVIPTKYLSHQAFHTLLREAEDEFGFHQAGVLRFPCPVPVFLNILTAVDPDHNIVNVLNEDRLGSNLGNDCRFTFSNLHDHSDVGDNSLSCSTYTYSSNHQTPSTTPSHSHALQPPPLCR